MQQDPTMNQMLIGVLGAILTTIVGIVGASLKSYLSTKILESKSGKARTQYEMGRNIVSDLVKSAKARGLNGQIENAGKYLRNYVLVRAQDEFDEHGLPFSAKVIDDMLEAAYIDTVQPALEVIEDELSQAPAMPVIAPAGS
jgi:hypothetical protein